VPVIKVKRKLRVGDVVVGPKGMWTDCDEKTRGWKITSVSTQGTAGYATHNQTGKTTTWGWAGGEIILLEGPEFNEDGEICP